MKKLLYITLLIGGIFSFTPSQAQVRINVNIGSQPLWGPVGYDYVRYYYMPEMDVYYDVVHRRYTYYHGNRWVTRSSLPSKYRRYNMYRTYKVVVNDHNPWHRHNHYHERYHRYSGNYSQVNLRDGRGRSDRHDRDRYDRHDRKDNHKGNKHRGKNKGRHHD
ncbi:hypothetical protein [Sphingobacterium spiritivorum]|uniref:Uncharacterized protein n=1 Tax=Sphingobacterium spiritivorum ATCC 33861 TaxID=525373 RepID=D7VTI8_SPHSI|nr:hypothetical protein [Sphingobacterium spiritivorum]EFK57089.1 hypothetical protein HMPREF0766_14292 [Sphingobacterium spiritivorum ATCC 33861]QQT34913.1 hypothetical protein I6J01_16665 [Sphingobacterium spiritivorum]WQD35806.1 hypothetical protein U0038_08610 [Sphingobacterium spiritivorum]SUJ02226.1 Uncharacterised protein [Sphingobacterium spiritivorum]